LFWLGEFVPAQELLAQGIAHYTPQQHRASLRYGGHDPGWCCQSYAAWTLCVRGYPDQALHQEQEALRLAQELPHPLTRAAARQGATRLHQVRREGQAAEVQAEAAMSISREHWRHRGRERQGSHRCAMVWSSWGAVGSSYTGPIS